MSIASANAIRAEHAASSRTRRDKREQEKYFQRTPPAQVREDNVRNAQANGTFSQTRFNYNKEAAGKAVMDGRGNITPVSKPPSKAAPTTTVPAGGGSYKEVAVPKTVLPPRPAPMVYPRPPSGVIKDETGDRTAEVQRNLSGDRNTFKPRPAPAPVAPLAQSGGKTAREMIDDADRAIAANKYATSKLRDVMKPRAPAVAAAPIAPSTSNNDEPDTKGAPDEPETKPVAAAPKKGGFFTRIAKNVASHLGGSPIGQEVSRAAAEVKAAVPVAKEAFKAVVVPPLKSLASGASSAASSAGGAITNSPGFQGSQLDRMMKAKASEPQSSPVGDAVKQAAGLAAVNTLSGTGDALRKTTKAAK